MISQLFKCLCAQWSVLKVDRGLLVREWVAENYEKINISSFA